MRLGHDDFIRMNLPPSVVKGKPQIKGATNREKVKALLRGQGEKTMKEMSDYLCVSEPVIYNLVPEMERRGEVKKKSQVRGKHNRKSYTYVINEV